MYGGRCYSASPELTFSGENLRPISITPERATGLDKIYVLYNVSGVSFSIPLSTPSDAKLYRYSNLGGGYADEVKSAFVEGSNLILPQVEGDMGYIVADGNQNYYFWIVNYEPYRFSVSGLSAASEQSCDATIIDFNGSAPAIHYYTITGQQKVLDREIKLVYDTQEWSADSNMFETVTVTKMYESIGSQIYLSPSSYCSTSYTLTGDKFLEEWNWQASCESVVIPPIAVLVKTEAIQENSDNANRSSRRMRSDDMTDNNDVSDDVNDDGFSGEESTEEGSNQIRGDEDGLGGSAPALIYFNAYATEGVIHHEWQMSKDPDFATVDYRFNEQNLEYTFTEEGTFYLRYIGSNYDGSCESIGDTYRVTIGGSELLCPNAFTPNGDGINDKWKVAYRSLLDFKCWIFDRYGRQLYYFDNPDDGWDGMRGDKAVSPGVYYYVIQATGADGKKYKKSGDINIIRHVERSESSANGSDEY